MAGAFQLLQQRLDVVVILSGAHAHKKRRHHEWCSPGIPVFGRQPTAQKPVDGPLEGVAGKPYFLFDQYGNIIVDG